MDVQQTAAALAGEGRKAAALETALRIFERAIRRETPAAEAEAALTHAFEAVSAQGAAVLDGADPQRIEDALYAAHPDSPLTEATLRTSWLRLVDQLGRTGDAPPFGGVGSAESWAFTARSRPSPYVDAGGVATAAARFGDGTCLVVVRGSGRSSFLAALRRALLGLHGADALVPPVIPAARDELARKTGVPTYSVCTDATLRRIARARPVTAAELLRIKGVRPASEAKYGEIFRRIVKGEPEDF